MDDTLGVEQHDSRGKQTIRLENNNTTTQTKKDYILQLDQMNATNYGLGEKQSVEDDSFDGKGVRTLQNTDKGLESKGSQ